MAARPPARAGGPAQCRQCGAPLVVAAGALGARCSYCGTDNLVALPPEWVEQIASESAGRHQSVLAALDEEAKVIDDAQGNLGVACFGAVLLLVLATLFWWGVSRDPSEPVWRQVVAQSPRPIFGMIGGDLRELPQAGSESVYATSDSDFFVTAPLRKGETISVSSQDFPSDEDFEIASTGYRCRWRKSLHATSTGAMIMDFTAPYSGWFDFFLYYKGPWDTKRPLRKYTLRFGIR